MAKITIPDELKADVPQTKWGKILTATPVVMTVVATMLAGLASSEMTRAQYSRSLAAQQQSKAGDQWSFFQAKRLRGSMQRSTLDVLQSTTALRPFDPTTLKQGGPAELSALLDSPAGAPTLAALLEDKLPATPAALAPDPRVKAALEVLESSKPETEITPFIEALNDPLLTEALRAAKDRVTALDVTLAPVNQAVDQIEKWLTKTSGNATDGTGVSRLRDFTAVRLRYTAPRYAAEARLTQAVANVYELLVRRSNLTAERHHRRSVRFFIGMLAAQAAVIVSTFSLAARKRSILWTLAAAAGLAAVSGERPENA